jgi:hypothetical protein
MEAATMQRREFLTACAATLLCRFSSADAPAGLVRDVETSILFPGRTSGPTWFHPRACAFQTPSGVQVLMTMQTISGSDVFGPVHWTASKDLGRTWSTPAPIEGFGRKPLDGDWQEGVCDVVPEFHSPTGTVLVMGHNVFYYRGVLARPQRRRFPVYAVRSADGKWSAPKFLPWGDSRGSEIYTAGGAQRWTLPDGDVLIPVSFAPKGRIDRAVTTLRCSFDGKELSVKQAGKELTRQVKRGLLEPSITFHDGVYYLTIRAEDDRGYVATSTDGLDWNAPEPWRFDDGQTLTMSTTQQRWLPHSDGLFLVYTRKTEENAKVFRWRGPLLMAQVDLKSRRLIRTTERVAVPLRWDAKRDPKKVARVGNFHTVAVGPTESWITVGEEAPEGGWKGDVMLARVRWAKANGLAPR